ncbi:GGDEF domain-containing phosphodiesterase [uncultured Arcobacter sp.]|uniref:EAL domain-containing protein n=1 Tax=uncultured Arcobacter sp. TaxID=165434 RepID=UPI0026086946|nr:GGDEF domain-containing phosphodiesterase [uncultured Arcobacter sp.]
MQNKTTYTRLILRIIIMTLTISLAIAFFYAQIMKKDAIESLSKIEAKKTTKLIFESFYSAMARGWTKEDLNDIIKRINSIEKNMVVNIYRGETVAEMFGDIPRDVKVRKENFYVKKAFQKDEILNLGNDSKIDYYYPIIATQECKKCHTNATTGEVLGVIAISYPIDELKISLSSIINFFIIFVLIFSLAIFVALFFEFDKYLVKPINKLISNILAISKEKDITKRIDLENDVEELHSMQVVFNKMLDSIEYQFYNDTLTGLPNRKRLIETITTTKNAVLMIINIDKFQEINDLYGDALGNEILKETAQLLERSKSPESKLFKLHADEYALYYEADVDIEEIKSIAIHLTNIIENETFYIDGSEIFINATFGIAYGSTSLLTNSDIALKLAKRTKKKYLVYDSFMNIEHEYDQNLKWAKRIKNAIKNDKVVPLYQPIVDIHTKKIIKYESLMRILDDDGKYISPFFFLELAKKNKLYPQLTLIMLDKTFEKFKNREEKVSINLSVSDILNETVHAAILKKLEEYQLGDRIIFEIIESDGIENFEEVLEFIKEVKTFGAKISIDDFGTGYSNFEYLMKLKVDYIKIDASMIKDIDTNRDSQMVTETIIDFAKKMNIQTVAEFIHSEAVYNKVHEIGVDYAQGYYFGMPAPLLD